MVPDHFRAPPGWTVLADAPAAWHAWYVAETGSTNSDLIEAAAAGAPDRTVLVTGHQTAGRGRLDRRWDAPPGSNLLMSVLFRAEAHGAQPLVRRLSVAAVRAVVATTGLEPRLKWPNDLLLDGRKLAGVLAQGSPSAGVVVGMGLNVGWAPEGAASLDAALEPLELASQVLSQFDQLAVHDVEGIDRHYRSLLDTLGRIVRVELAGQHVVGRALDLDADGRLVVLDECSMTHRIDAGDVIHVRPDEADRGAG